MTHYNLDFNNFLKRKNEIIERTEQLLVLYQKHSQIELQFNHAIVPPGFYILGIAAQCMTTGIFHVDTLGFRQFDNIVERVFYTKIPYPLGVIGKCLQLFDRTAEGNCV